MKLFKITTALLLATLLCAVALTGAFVFAADPVVATTSADGENIVVGGEATFTVSLSEAVTVKAFALDFSTAYDHDIFEWVDGQWSDRLRFDAMTDVNEKEEVAAVLNTQEITASGTIFTFTLRVKDTVPCETAAEVEVVLAGIDGAVTQSAQVVIDHTYSAVCDKSCDVCGGTREVTSHEYDDDCDEICNACGGGRTAPHAYDNDGDAVCNECGATRTVEYRMSTALSEKAPKIGDEVTAVVSLDKPINTRSFALDLLNSYDHTAFEWVSGDWTSAVKATGVVTAVVPGSEAVFMAPDGLEVPADGIFQFVLRVKDTALCETPYEIKVVAKGIENLTLAGETVLLNHVYSSDCDLACDLCGGTREPLAQHKYESDGDESCDFCGELRLALYGTSLSLQHNFAINYKVKATLLEKYSDFAVEVEMNGVTVQITDYTNDGTYLSFRFANIAPQRIGDAVTATLLAKKNGEDVKTVPYEFGVKQYCDLALEVYAADEHAAFRTLVVDLLRYAAKAQLYVGYKTDAPVDGDLTETQKSWGTPGDPNLTNHFVYDFATIENPTATWYGAGLVLDTAVTLKLKFRTASIDGLKVRIVVEDGDTIIIEDPQHFVYNAAEDVYVLHVNGLCADQMSKKLALTVLDADGNAVSNTAQYSIESYAYEKQNSTVAGLADLVKAMMHYGNAAAEYGKAQVKE